VDETVLASLEYPEAKLLAEYLMVTKRLGQLAEGDQAWLKQVKNDGRIHGGVITNGAVTGRATHSNPNVAQVPANRAPYGRDCRALFRAEEGKVLVGADLSGLELRCLAHYMARFDGGLYSRALLEGDIHTTNQEAAELATRDQAKTFIYAFLYGAGSAKIGSIVGKGAGAGANLKKRFLAQTPALAKLVTQVQLSAEKGYLIGLDGRRLHIRSTHAALNTLLQSAGALIAKEALCQFSSLVSTKGWNHRVQQVAWIHDEVQIETDKEIADEVGQMAVRAFELAGEAFGFRVPITGEYRIGSTWAETH
jgi:DNA polymerase I-like protein with 3'-5' exonuclease and polymerase domains